MQASSEDIKTLQTLKKRADFVDLNKKGQKWVADTLIVQYLKTDNNDKATAIGFTVTKKLGNAVVRNRIKRRLRAAAADIIPGNIHPNITLNIIGRQAALEADASKIRKDLSWCLKRLKVYLE